MSTAPTATISPEFPFVYRDLDVLGSTMRYIEAGEGPPVLFLHGNPTSSYLWRNVIPLVAPVGRCIALDLIGMGASDKPPIDYRFADHARYLEAALDALALDDVTLVLHDWGSALGFDWASRHETRVRGLAFMEAFLMPAPGYEVFPEKLRDDFREFRTPALGRQRLVRENRFIEHVLPASVVRELSERELDHYRAPFRDESARTPLWRWPNEIPIAGEPADVHATIEAYRDWLQRTPLPKLLIHADPGVLIPAPLVEWAKAYLPELETVHVGHGIHYLQEDHPDAIGAAIAEWIERRREPSVCRVALGHSSPRAAGSGVAAAKDLSVEAPRGLDAELDGYAWLPRMLDKARATLAGTAGGYLFGCPVDHTCMARLGISPELVLRLAAEHADDAAVLAELRAHGIPDAQDAWFDGQAVEDELQATGTYLRVRRRDELPTAAGGRVFAGAEHGAEVSVVLIDAAPAETQAPHTHPVEEVVIVQDGEATFFLGSQQARIVRAGEVVRVPRGVTHRWIASDEHGVRAVAVYGASEVVTSPA